MNKTISTVRTVFAAVLVVVFGACKETVKESVKETGTKQPAIVAVYYPHWHIYDHGQSWKGEGWTERKEMADAKPEFPGHEQPKRSVLGDFDENDPKWVEKEIYLAADPGVDVFLYESYWSMGVKCMEEALEQGFLKAVNRNRMKFALMWANHDRRDQFYPEYQKPGNIWLFARYSPRDLRRVVGYGIEQLLKDAAAHVANDPDKPFGILLNAWNEWTEGSYLLPEERTGTAYLEAIRNVFGPNPNK